MPLIMVRSTAANVRGDKLQAGTSGLLLMGAKEMLPSYKFPQEELAFQFSCSAFFVKEILLHRSMSRTALQPQHQATLHTLFWFRTFGLKSHYSKNQNSANDIQCEAHLLASVRKMLQNSLFSGGELAAFHPGS